MLRKLLYVFLLVSFSLAGLGGCNDDDESNGMVGRSYVYGSLDGALAEQLLQVFAPRPWRGETNGPVLMPSTSLVDLSESQKTALRTLIKGGHAVLVTSSKDDHVKATHALTGSPVAFSLGQMPASLATAEVYGLAEPDGRMRMILAPSFPISPDPEPESSKQKRATSVADWLLESVRGVQKQTTLSATDVYPIPVDAPPWLADIATAMPAYWGTCGIKTQQCVNNITLHVASTMVYSSSAYTNQPSDFFVMRMTADVGTAGCAEFYKGKDHDNRIAAYWLRQVNMSALVPGVSFNEFNIPASEYNPQSSNPSTTMTTGVTWSLGGTGTVGANAAQGGLGSIGFNAGVSYSDTRTTSFQAVSTKVNINADPANLDKASWTYDSWNYVSGKIEPSNHACPNGLLKNDALPSIIYGGTFSPVQSWVWAAQPSVRARFDGNVLPVQIDTNLLLGWTYYFNTMRACPAESSVGSYDLNGQKIDVVGERDNPSNGLNFDVSCGTGTNFGTIPLGPYDKSDQQGSGNPGTPYSLGVWQVNVPFAPDPRLMTLSGISPTKGSEGATVTLTGSHLGTANMVNFGGTQITTFASHSDTAIQVAAPKGTGKVEVSVSNGTITSQSFPFTYTW